MNYPLSLKPISLSNLEMVNYSGFGEQIDFILMQKLISISESLTIVNKSSEKIVDHLYIFPEATNDRESIKKAVARCRGVLTALVPWGIQQYSSRTAQAVMDIAEPDARLVFSCGRHITRDGQNTYSRSFKTFLKAFTWIGRLFRLVETDDQVQVCRRIFESNTQWTVVRGSDLEEGESQGLPAWSRAMG